MNRIQDLEQMLAFADQRYLAANGRYALKFKRNGEWKYVGPFFRESDCERYIPIAGGSGHEIITMMEVDYS